MKAGEFAYVRQAAIAAGISLAASDEGIGHAALTMLVFGVGVATVLIALAYGSREILRIRRQKLMALMPWAKPIMGTTFLVVGLAVFFHIDRMLETWLLDAMPAWLLDLSIAV